MVWLLPTRGRAKGCQETIDACVATKMSSPCYILIDTRVDDYPDLKLPDNMIAVRLPLDMGDCMRLIFQMFPYEKSYGWLADDVRPRTDYWDKELENAAADWRLSNCDDLWLANAKNPPLSLCGAFCWGGKLVRAVGWWAPPGYIQAGIDDTWVFICAKKINLMIYCVDVVVEHLNYRTEKRPWDDTDDWERDGAKYVEADLEREKEWEKTDDARLVLKNLTAAITEDGYRKSIG